MDPIEPNSRRRADAIEAWFRSHEDGNFCVYPVQDVSLLQGDPLIARTMVYTTKSQCLPRIQGLASLPQPICVLGRYGLPLAADMECLANLPDSTMRIFIGDADPPDLLIFAWIKEYQPITWHGVSDDLLRLHHNLGNHRLHISLSKAEKSAVTLLPQFCPEYRELLGEYCSSLLEKGLKIELEGAISKI